MRIISWNVNGIRACVKKGCLDFFKDEDADIICIQETKAHPDQVDKILEQYPHHHWNSAEKKGYSGTAIFSKVKPLSVVLGMGKKEHDKEGRVITAEYKDFFLVNVYVPNAQHELARMDYRQKWDKDFLAYLKKLEKKKPVVFCGDMNVAHKEIDLEHPKANKNNAGFTQEERDGFSKYIDSGFIDTFREFNDRPRQYSWWSYRMNARSRNVGWRIDYFCISKKLRPKLKKAFILPKVMGSDHCPVGIELR
ncbi:MAG: exodeoxyribonuclease III [Candidatus Nanoarchaeia archaeon]